VKTSRATNFFIASSILDDANADQVRF
jgi:hypothetical protein